MQYVDTWHDVEKKSKYANRVMRRDKFDVVHMHLKKGEEVSPHHSKEEMLIIVRSGRVEVTVKGKIVELTNEHILQMDPYEERELKAIEQTDLLMLKFK